MFFLVFFRLDFSINIPIESKTVSISNPVVITGILVTVEDDVIDGVVCVLVDEVVSEITGSTVTHTSSDTLNSQILLMIHINLCLPSSSPSSEIFTSVFHSPSSNIVPFRYTR